MLSSLVDKVELFVKMALTLNCLVSNQLNCFTFQVTDFREIKFYLRNATC